MIPIGDEPNPRGTPVITYALIAANVLVFLLIAVPLMSQPVDPRDPGVMAYLRFLAERAPGISPRELLAQTSAYDLFTFEHGFRPAAPSVGSLFFSLFLHGGWMHLLGNMLFLWIFGDNVEARLGRLRYLGVYLFTGVAATLFFMLFDLHSQAPLIGASGAISGILGCYFLWFPENRVRILVILLFFIDIWRVPARWVLGFFLIVDNLLPFLVGGDSGVAHGAHIGGFLAGLGIAAISTRRWRRVRPPPPRAHEKTVLGEPTNIIGFRPRPRLDDTFGMAVHDQRWQDAADLYSRMSADERRVLRGADVLALAGGLRDRHEFEAALAVLQHFIANRPESPFLPQAHLAAGFVHLEGTGHLEAARQHFLTVLDLSSSPELMSAAREGLAMIADLGRSGDGYSPL